MDRVAVRPSTSSGLYGRQAEQRMLEEAYRRRCSGHEETLLSRELVLICGPSGSGKSSLAGALRDVVQQDGGLFIVGKFDQLQRPEPYAPFVAAFSMFADLAAAKGQEFVETMRERASERVGMGGALLVETVPALEVFLGPREEGASFTGAEVQKQQFMAAFRDFVRAVSSPECPLVLFIDDLQWADEGSVDLLSALANDRDQDGFLLLGAGRGNEIGRHDPISMALRELEETQVVITEIGLSHFTREEVQGYVSELFTTLNADINLDKLAEFLYHRTSGNLFSLHHVLRSCKEEGILTWDDQKRKWLMDIKPLSSKSKQRKTTVEVMVGVVERLPEGVQIVLETAACLGASFQVRHLSIALPDLDVVESLELAQEKEIVRLDDGRRLGWFTHDRMQEATYATIHSDRRPTMHLSIGRILLDQLPEEEIEENLFLIVNQLGLGVDSLQDQNERDALAALCLRAGQKAVSSSAFITASDYLSLGIRCLGERHWRHQYKLSLALFDAAAEVEYCNANYERTEALIDEVLDNARSFEDEIQAYNTRMFALGAQQKHQEACDTGLYVLSELGVPFPGNPSKLRLMWEVLKTKWMLRSKTADDILNLPLLKEPEKLATMRILNLLYLYFVFSKPPSVPLVATTIVQQTLRYGLSGMGCSGFGFYGMLLCGVLGEIEQGYKYCQVALRILERFDAKVYMARVYAPVYGMVIHWKEPFRNCLAPLRTAHRVGLESGDIEFAIVSNALYFLQAWLAGVPLPTLLREGRAFDEEMKAHKQGVVRSIILPSLQMVANLMGESSDPCLLTGEFMSEEDVLRRAKESNNPAAVTNVFVRKMMLAYYVNDFDSAADAAAKSRSIGKEIVSSSSTALQAFFDGLTALEMARSSRNKRSNIKTARRALKKMKKWAKHAPRNYLHKVHLLEAEMSVVKGDLDASLSLYRASIDEAKAEGFVQDQALACERAGVALRSFGQEKEACKFFVEAHGLYGEWGARVKVDQLDRVIDSGHFDTTDQRASKGR